MLIVVERSMYKCQVNRSGLCWIVLSLIWLKCKLQLPESSSQHSMERNVCKTLKAQEQNSRKFITVRHSNDAQHVNLSSTPQFIFQTTVPANQSRPKPYTRNLAMNLQRLLFPTDLSTSTHFEVPH